MFCLFGWTRGGPHKYELSKFCHKLELMRALLLYIYIYICMHAWRQFYPLGLSLGGMVGYNHIHDDLASS